MSQDKGSFDATQSASAAQFDRQSERYGKSHILADTQDLAQALQGIAVPANGRALDVATGGGHTALFLSRQGWSVTAGDISERMLANAKKLCAEAGFALETRMFPAEEIPFANGAFDLVTTRVAAHHFSSPEKFVTEVGRVLKGGGHFLLIDGSAPDDDPETGEWLHQVEKWRDPSHGRFLSPKSWQELVRRNGMKIVLTERPTKKQPDLEWYFETAATPAENRAKVMEYVRTASAHVRQTLRLTNEDGKIVWWWPMVTILARKG